MSIIGLTETAQPFRYKTIYKYNKHIHYSSTQLRTQEYNSCFYQIYMNHSLPFPALYSNTKSL